MRIDVSKSRELTATILALKSIEPTLAKQIRQHTRRIAEPEWKEALSRRADTRLEHRVISGTAVVSVTNQNVRVKAAGKGRMLRGGLEPKYDYPGVEFGSNKGKTKYSRVSPKGKRHTVVRVTGTQLKPFNGKGYVFWPSAKEMVPRMGALWVQTTVKTIANALEGKQD